MISQSRRQREGRRVPEMWRQFPSAAPRAQPNADVGRKLRQEQPLHSPT
jgi:hypothetical protein